MWARHDYPPAGPNMHVKPTHICTDGYTNNAYKCNLNYILDMRMSQIIISYTVISFRKT